MKYATTTRGVWAICLLAISFLIAAPAGAAQINVPLNTLDGNVTYNSNGGLSATGISGTGNLLLGDLDFSIPDVSSTTFNSILAGSLPVLATLSLSGNAAGQSATLTTSETFTDLASLGVFFTSAADESNVLNFGSGNITGDLNASLSDIFVNATNRSFGGASGAGPNQLTGGTANVLATISNVPAGNGTFDFSGDGSLTLQQVAVPEPAYMGLLALALLGIGLILLREERMPHA